MVVYCLLAKISCAALPRPRRSCQRGPAAGGGAGPPPGPGAAARAAPAAVGAPGTDFPASFRPPRRYTDTLTGAHRDTVAT